MWFNFYEPKLSPILSAEEASFGSTLGNIHWELQEMKFYYISTNEIPGELSRENLISSHAKITCYLHMWKYHHCYGFVINHVNTRREISYLRVAMYFPILLLKYTQLWPKNNWVHNKTVNGGVSMSQFWHIKNVFAWNSPKEGAN